MFLPVDELKAFRFNSLKSFRNVLEWRGGRMNSQTELLISIYGIIIILFRKESWEDDENLPSIP